MKKRISIFRVLGLVLVFLLISGGLNAQQPPAKKAPAQAQAAQAAPPGPSQPASSPSPADKPLSVTHHTIAIGGRPIPYSATVGTLTVNKPNEQPGARIFFMAYTQDGIKDLSGRVKMGYYETGHMMYIHKPSQTKLKADLAEFVKAASRR